MASRNRCDCALRLEAPDLELIAARDDRCTMCCACIDACPVGAVNAEDGAIRVRSDVCIGCGSCVRECVHGAAAFSDGVRAVLDLLAQGDTTVIVAPGFAGAFPNTDPLRLIGALRGLGFASVWEAAAGGEMLFAHYRAELAGRAGRIGAAISSACPAVVRLIEVHRPDLVPNLVPVVSPIVATSRAARVCGQRQVVCIASCAALRMECCPGDRVQSGDCVRGVEGGPDAVLTFAELRKLIDESGLCVDDCSPSMPDVTAEGPGRMLALPAGLLHSLDVSGGAFRQGAVSAMGPRECSEVLDAISSGEFTASLVEISLCRGCVDGPGYPAKSAAWQRRRAVTAYSAAMENADGTSISARLASSGVGAGEIVIARSFAPAPPAGFERDTARPEPCALVPAVRSLSKPDGGARAPSQSFMAEGEPVDMVAYSAAMEAVITLVQKVSNVSSTVLITGASGVGKEVVARYIHRTGNRSAGPFVKINCAAIPETLLESELFGYEQGAFTGARRDGKPGLIELASGGTLFLDEITEMPLGLQAKLLQVLQEKRLVRVGGTRQIRVDARIMAATNRDIERAVKEGHFRNDLFYRLNVIPIRVPALAERTGDIAPLTYHFLDKWSARYGRRRQISREAREALERYSWPGNVRELENMLEFLVVTVEEPVIGIEHLPTHIKRNGTGDAGEVRVSGILPLRRAVEEVERQLIERASQTCSSTYSMARALGVNQSTIVRKIQKHMNGRA